MTENVSNVLARLGEARVLPVVELDTSEVALPLVLAITWKRGYLIMIRGLARSVGGGAEDRGLAIGAVQPRY